MQASLWETITIATTFTKKSILQISRYSLRSCISHRIKLWHLKWNNYIRHLKKDSKQNLEALKEFHDLVENSFLNTV